MQALTNVAIKPDGREGKRKVTDHQPLSQCTRDRTLTFLPMDFSYDCPEGIHTDSSFLLDEDRSPDHISTMIERVKRGCFTPVAKGLVDLVRNKVFLSKDEQH